MTQAQPADLNRRDPRTYLQVMYWCFVAPGKMYSHRKTHGDATLQYVGIWLTTVWLWIPLFIPATGYFLGLVPLNNTVATIFLLAFPTGIWYLYTRADLSGALLGVLFFHVHLIDKSAADGDLRVALLGHLALISAYSAAVIISNATVNPSYPTSAFVIVLAGVGAWVAWHVSGAGFTSGFLIGLLSGLLWAPFIIETGNHQRKLYRRPNGRSVMPFAASLISTISIAVLIWLYWLNGWNIAGQFNR